MKKSKIVLNLKELSLSGKLEKMRELLTALTDNPNFPTPIPELGVLSKNADLLETTLNELKRLLQQVAATRSQLQQLEELIDSLLIQLAAYIQAASGGDEARIRSLGLDVRANASRAVQPAQPLALVASPGTKPGSIQLKWKPVRGAYVYTVEITTTIDDPKSWKTAGVVTKSKLLLEGLEQGTHYWFQVAVTGAGGQSAWSDPATRMAP